MTSQYAHVCALHIILLEQFYSALFLVAQWHLTELVHYVWVAV